ncbi:MAG: GNAT family N-acetyltransferase, partial [Bacteroidota bacterium]
IGDRGIKNPEAAKEYIKNITLPQLERLGYSNFTVIRSVDQVKIGTCGLYDRNTMEGIDLGYAFLPKYEKQGYAFEACNTLVNVAYEEFGLETLNAITLSDNTTSIQLLDKLGFSYQKIVRFEENDVELYIKELV